MKTNPALKIYLTILLFTLFFGINNYSYCQDTLRRKPKTPMINSFIIGLNYQIKENKNISTKIFELGTDFEFIIHIGNKTVCWDGWDSNGNRIGGRYKGTQFLSTLRVSGLYYYSNEPAFGLLLGDRLISNRSLIPYVFGLNCIMNTDFSNFKFIVRPEIGLSFFNLHRLVFMLGIDLPINNASFKYYDKCMPQIILNYKLLDCSRCRSKKPS